MHTECTSWPSAYTANNKHPVLEMGGHMRLDSLWTYIATAENLEFLDTPVHIHAHMVTMHKNLIQDYNDRTHCNCTTNYDFIHAYVSFVQMLLTCDVSIVGLKNF